MTDKPPFLLLHGGRHGGWCWTRVAEHLRAAGHAVFTPTLTGLGERSHLLSPDIDLSTHVQDVLGVVEWEGLDDFVLVAHSYGGAVASAAMETLRERVRSLVLLDAHMPATGQSVLDLVDQERAQLMRRMVENDGEGWFVPTSDAAWWGLDDPQDIAWVNSKITPQPFASYVEPSPPTDYARTHPYTFIECSESRLTPEELAWQRARAAAHPDSVRHRVIEGCHDVMVTSPEAVAGMLREAIHPPAGGTVPLALEPGAASHRA